MSPQPGQAVDGKDKMVDPATVAENLRNLTVQLHRGNSVAAKTFAEQAVEQLQEIIQAGVEPEGVLMGKAQQTMFALEEVRIMLSEDDINSALAAARDAAKEWRVK